MASLNFHIAKPGDEKILIITEDTIEGGVDSQYFDNVVKKYILGEICLEELLKEIKE